MNSKMTTQELSTLMIDKITFITTDPRQVMFSRLSPCLLDQL